MKRLMEWRMTGLAVLFVAMAATVAQAQQPTVVFSIRGIDPLLDDAAFIGAEVGQDEVKDTADGFVEGVTGGKGLAGIDRKKPLGIYWNATADGPPEMPVAFLPVSDEAALKDMLKELAPDFKDTKGLWTATIPNGTKLYGKVSGGFLYLSIVPPVKLADPTKITNSKYDIALDVSIAGIPEEFKELFLTQAEAQGRQQMENGAEPKNEADRVGREMILEGGLAVLKALVNDGEKLTFGVDVDQKARVGAIDVALTSKSNSALSKVMAAYAKIQPAFAAIGSETAPFRLVVSHPAPGNAEQLDALFKGIKSTINEKIDDNDRIDDKDRPTTKGIVGRLLDIFLATAKSGSLHSGLVLEAGGKDKIRVLGGAKVANGDEAAKLLDDVIKLSKDKPELAKVKVDAAKHAGARIHAVTPELNETTEEQFGNEPAHLAFRADSLWMSIGGDNLTALKKALDAKPSPRATTSPISLQVKPAALVLLMEKDNEGLIERAKEVVGKPGDKYNIEVAPIANGTRVRLEFGVDLLQLIDQGEE